MVICDGRLEMVALGPRRNESCIYASIFITFSFNIQEPRGNFTILDMMVNI
jgi:hypothetical protein